MKAVISYQLSGTRWELKPQSRLILIEVVNSEYLVKNWSGDCCEHLCRQFWTLLWYIFSIPDNFVQ